MGCLDTILIYGLIKSIIKSATDTSDTTINYNYNTNTYTPPRTKHEKKVDKLRHKREVLEAKRQLIAEKDRYARAKQNMNAPQENGMYRLQITNEHDAEREIYRAMPMPSIRSTSGFCNNCGSPVFPNMRSCPCCGLIIPKTYFSEIESIRMQCGTYAGVEMNKQESYKEIALAREKRRMQKDQLDFAKSAIPTVLVSALIIAVVILCVIGMISN